MRVEIRRESDKSGTIRRAGEPPRVLFRMGKPLRVIDASSLDDAMRRARKLYGRHVVVMHA